jgi:hypothetical protein
VNISEIFGFSAPPEVLFNTLTDIDRAERWLPAGVRIEPLGEQRVRVMVGQTSRECTYSADAGNLCIIWQFAGSPDLHGLARVDDGPVGGSHMRIKVTAPDAADTPQRVRAFIDEAARHLERDLSDNLTAG